ncbi:MAG: hypothetical protein K2J63_03475 [Muribaculaceae bacterium]|nr:hypothetical protein [Muribaculaceae bacterium]
MKKTTRALQQSIIQNLGLKANILIETVAKVQGLTTDITIFFVPDYSLMRTLEPHLFNVATSRAREHTIIVMDKYVFEYPTLDTNVRIYLETLKKDFCVYVSSKIEEKGYLQNQNRFLFTALETKHL